ncbi:MAG TPA: LLM class flavin-dependent oxidoreductase [Bryobacteraceae bacterium]|nr:LLM class flavin-dependent oxidoreductase [Bryobacteraceae bacterium]
MAHPAISALSRGPAPAETGRAGLELFSTCPSSLEPRESYVDRIVQAAQWSERAGCTGMLVYTDNSMVDPWLVSQILIQNTRSLSPLVAVQPVYMHPYTVAKMVATLAFLYRRRIYLNMVAGGFKNDLAALNDSSPHDDRYTRLIEYTQIIQGLMQGFPVTRAGQFYSVTNLTLNPRVPPDLRPGVLMSGSSDAGQRAARATNAVAVTYPEPPESGTSISGPGGVRIGIVTRPRSDAAWKAALARFPSDRRGQLTRQLATKVSDSSWHHRLSEVGREAARPRRTYWLEPFENYQTNCPYLVGSYQEVAAELERYIALGHRTFILDIPATEAELEHTAAAFQTAMERAGL